MGNCGGMEKTAAQEHLQEVQINYLPNELEKIRAALQQAEQISDSLVTLPNELHSSQGLISDMMPDVRKSQAILLNMSSSIKKPKEKQAGGEQQYNLFDILSDGDYKNICNNEHQEDEDSGYYNSTSYRTAFSKKNEVKGNQPPEKLFGTNSFQKGIDKTSTRNNLQQYSEHIPMIFEDSGESFQKRYKNIKVYARKSDQEHPFLEDSNIFNQSSQNIKVQKNLSREDEESEIESEGNYEGSDEENFKTKEKLIDNLFSARNERLHQCYTVTEDPNEHTDASGNLSSKRNRVKGQGTQQTPRQITVFPSLAVNGGTFQGETFETKRNGLGQQTFLDGTIYLGEWHQDKRTGKGIQIWPDDTLYEGEWKENEIEGLGKIEYSNNSYYIGEWKANKFHGKGRFQHFSGAYYDGFWEYDMQNGKGIEVQIYPHFSKYEGIFEKGKKNGKGRLIMGSDTEYKGDFVDNAVEGLGVYRWPSGVTYEGRWVGSRMNGSGKMVWPNGITYQGEFKDDQKSGVGTIEYSDGNKYVGDWNCDKQHGKGTFYFRKTFSQLKGEWVYGKLLQIQSIYVPKNSTYTPFINPNINLVEVPPNMIKSFNSQKLNNDRNQQSDISYKGSQFNKSEKSEENKKNEDINMKKGMKQYKKVTSIQNDY